MGVERKVRVGIAGCGVVATAYYLPSLYKMDTVELTAVCDRYETRIAACLRLFGAKAGYLDYYEMLEKADLDAVFILTAPGTHVPFTLKAVEKGLHVLIQKPLATNMVDAHRIAAAVRAKDVVALVEVEELIGRQLRPNDYAGFGQLLHGFRQPSRFKARGLSVARSAAGSGGGGPGRSDLGRPSHQGG